MYKEFIILFIILASVIILEIITQNYTQGVIENLTFSLSELKADLEGLESSPESEDTIIQNSNKIYDDLMNYHDRLALYIDHLELEKVETSIISCKSFLEASLYKEAINELEKTNFTFEHIRDKYAFNLSNIF